MTDDQNQVTIFEDIPWLQEYAPVIDAFMNGRYPENSIFAFRDRCKDFAKWAERVESQEVGKQVLRMPIAPADLVCYARALDGRGMALSTIRSYVSTIGTMHNAAGLHNPTVDAGVKGVLAEFREKHADDELRRARTLSEADIESILSRLHLPRRAQGGMMESPETAYKRASLDKAMLLTMVEAGMRRNEATRLVWGDVWKQVDGLVLVRLQTNWKRRRQTWVSISEICFQTLLEIKADDADRSASVFNLSSSQITRRLKRMCEEAGIDPTDVSGHTPRATLLKLMVEKRVPVDMLQQQLRLQPLSAVEQYIEHNERMREGIAMGTIVWHDWPATKTTHTD